MASLFGRVVKQINAVTYCTYKGYLIVTVSQNYKLKFIAMSERPDL